MNTIKNLSKVGLQIDLKIVSKLKNDVKNNFNCINTCSEVLDKYPFLKNDITRRIRRGILPQPGRIVESIIIQTLSDYLCCVYTGDGIYTSDKYTLKQDGGPGKPDLTITDNTSGESLKVEIKGPISYCKSSGFTYDNDGYPLDFTSVDNKHREYFQSLFGTGSLLRDYNILDNIGHNKTFVTRDIITSDFDYIISYDRTGKILVMTIDEYKDNFTFKVEVRSCGRNMRSVFTMDKLNVVGDSIKLDDCYMKDIIQRGGSTSKRCKLIKNNATFSFWRKDVYTVDNCSYININKVKQHVGEVSIQHFINRV